MQQSDKDKSPWAYLTSDYQYRDLVISTLNPRCEFKSLSDALANTSMAIHHGGLTTSIGCLLAGIPQLLLPRHLEQQLTAFALQNLGVAEMLTAPLWEDLCLVQTQVYRRFEQSQRLAEILSKWNKNLVGKVINSCLKMKS
jgi:hypothetical protein